MVAVLGKLRSFLSPTNGIVFPNRSLAIGPSMAAPGWGRNQGVIRLSVDMRPQLESPHLEIATLATRQHGVVSHRQLLELGLGAAAIQRRLRAGSLHRVHRGVYAVGHRRLSPQGKAMAAVLACGRGAVLSHRSAAAQWGLLRSSRARVDVTTPRRAG